MAQKTSHQGAVKLYTWLWSGGFISSNSLLLIGQQLMVIFRKSHLVNHKTTPQRRSTTTARAPCVTFSTWCRCSSGSPSVRLRNLFDLIIIVLSLLETALDLWVALSKSCGRGVQDQSPAQNKTSTKWISSEGIQFFSSRTLAVFVFFRLFIFVSLERCFFSNQKNSGEEMISY